MKTEELVSRLLINKYKDEEVTVELASKIKKEAKEILEEYYGPKIGDVVILELGEKKEMKVVSILERTAKCIYFLQSGEIKETPYIPFKCLKLAPQNSSIRVEKEAQEKVEKFYGLKTGDIVVIKSDFDKQAELVVESISDHSAELSYKDKPDLERLTLPLACLTKA